MTCRRGEECRGGICRGCGNGGPCLVFVTSTGHDGNFGGLHGADAICQDFATKAGLPGTFKAWLSDTTQSPVTRFTRNANPYRLVDGTKIADGWSDLTSGNIDHPIDVMATGERLSAYVLAATHTKPNGQAQDGTNDCAGWTSGSRSAEADLGLADVTNAAWTSAGHLECGPSPQYLLYCFQQP